MKCHKEMNKGSFEACLRSEQLKLRNLAPIFPNLQAETYIPWTQLWYRLLETELRFPTQKAERIKTVLIWGASTGNFLSNNSGDKWNSCFRRERNRAFLGGKR
jgi:hypothetical protein